jgi:DNA-binding NtrC family response regulator
VQVKLLRVLQDHAFERVGGAETVRVDVRVVAATTRDLESGVRNGWFRQDLLHRLAAARIVLPPLRERREDIPMIVSRWLAQHGVPKRDARAMTRGAVERLTRHDWPGNLTELRGTLETMVAFAGRKRTLDHGDLPAGLREPNADVEILHVTVGMTVDEVERQLLIATLRHTGHDKPRTAALLGIGLRTLYRKIKQYGID